MTVTLKINDFKKLISDIQREIYDLGNLLTRISLLTLEDIRPLQERLLTVGNREYENILDEIYEIQTRNERTIFQVIGQHYLNIINTETYFSYKLELYNVQNYIETVTLEGSEITELSSLKNKLRNVYYYKDELAMQSGLVVLSDSSRIVMFGCYCRPNCLKIDHENRTMTFRGCQYI